MIPFESMPALPAARVQLRRLTERDLDDLLAIFSDPEVMRYWSSPPLADREGARKLLDEIHGCFDRRELFQWGVARRDDDRVIGTCTLFHLHAGSRRAEVGFALRRDHWGQGWMTEAVGRLVQFAFRDLDLVRLEADVDPRNAPSIRLLERLGFRREGLMRERWLVNGETQDALILGLLRREWEVENRGADPPGRSE